MMSSSVNARLLNFRLNSILGSVALGALLFCAPSLSHAEKTIEEQEEASRVRCLWHIGSKVHRVAALETLRKNAMQGKWQPHLRYLKKLSEFLKEDPAYHPANTGSFSEASQNDESPYAFLEGLHTQVLQNLSTFSFSHPAEREFETIKLNFFYERVKKRLTGDSEESLNKDTYFSLTALQFTPDVRKRLLLKTRFFKSYYLNDTLDTNDLVDTAEIAIDTAVEVALSSQLQEEAKSLRRLASRINFKIAESVPSSLDPLKRSSRRQSYLRTSSRFGNGLAKFYLAEIHNDESSGLYNAKNALDWYSDSANDDCPLAANKLASFFENGNEKLGILQNKDRTLEWHKKAAKYHPTSQYVLGKHLLDQGRVEDVEEGLRLIRQSAEVGHSPAQLLLGQSYRDGRFVDKDPHLAFYWLQQAADQNEVQAYYSTAYALEKGIGTSRDEARALYYYKLASKQDDFNALVRMGKLYLKGRGMERPSEDMALSYFQQASGGDNRDGTYYYGLMSLLGKGFAKPDPVQAFSLLSQASEKGHVKASEKVGLLKQFGLGTDQNYEEAHQAFAKAQTPTALYHLGWLHKRGLGIQQDPSQAITHWEQAATLGNTFAAYRAGKAHLKMWKETENEESGQKAYQYLSQASEALPDAMYLLGTLQKKGVGCNQDLILSAESLKKAAERAHAEAQFKRGCLIEDQAEEGWEENSFNWYERASSQNHKKAHQAVSRFYREGIGRERNLTLAFNSVMAAKSIKDPSNFSFVKQLAKEDRHEEALKFIEKQAEKSTIPALVFMAKAAEEGILVPQNMPKAISLYQSAWLKGNRTSYLRLKELEQAQILKTLSIDINL